VSESAKRNRSCRWTHAPGHFRRDDCVVQFQRAHITEASLCLYTQHTLQSPHGLLLLGDDLVCDLVVGGLRDHFFSYQVRLLGVGTAVDDFLRIGRSDAG